MRALFFAHASCDAWRKAHTFDGTSQVSTWLFAIAYRQALKALRRLDWSMPDPVDEPAAPHETEPDRELAQLQLRARLDEALSHLSAEHRAVIELTYFQGYSCKEIAQITDCPVATVKTRMPFSAMESYFQREGRDWERYAWQKARPVAGDAAAGDRFLETLRPFIYRRYLDYGALDGLREMKAAIAAEVARKELADDIKRGPGGIREIEFLVQALQLIRGGREASLRERRLLPALSALVAAGHGGGLFHR